LHSQLLTPEARPAAGLEDTPETTVNHLVELVFREILVACGEATVARQSAPVGGPEWQKRTGEILAYGRVTHVLDRLKNLTVESHGNG
jgi:hypothetical protein